MNDRDDTMLLNLFMLNAGHHEASWRLPESDPRAEWNVRHWIDIARKAEAGGLHSLFLADVMAMEGPGLYGPEGSFDPVTLMALLAGATERIGLISTISVTYSDPYGLARRLATLDHLSGGRAGWNVVTSVTDVEPPNFGLEGQIDYASRYARADEFMEVVTDLWDSWPEDAILADRASGRYIEAGRIRPIDHVGEHFRVKGPINVPRPPQGHPLIVQAGSSPTGIAFASRWADVVFTAQQHLDRAQAYYRSVKEGVRDAGRSPDAVRVLPGIVPIVGRTREEARAIATHLDAHIVVERGIEGLEFWIGRSIAGLDIDEPFPSAWFDEPLTGMVSRAEVIFDMAKREELTIRQVLQRLAGGRGHVVVVGTAEEVADRMEEWFRGRAADGFNVMPPRIPADLDLFIELVVPLLVERGLFAPACGTGTLREQMRLPRPELS